MGKETVNEVNEKGKVNGRQEPGTDPGFHNLPGSTGLFLCKDVVQDRLAEGPGKRKDRKLYLRYLDSKKQKRYMEGN